MINHNQDYLSFKVISAAVNTVVGSCSEFNQGASLMAKPPNDPCSECIASHGKISRYLCISTFAAL